MLLTIYDVIVQNTMSPQKSEHRNIKAQGITTTETSFIKLVVSIDFVNHPKPRRVEFVQRIFKNILVR